MSISNVMKSTSSSYTDLKCDSMECKNMIADTFTILSAEVDDLTVNQNLDGNAEVNIIHTLTAGGTSGIEEGESLQSINVHGAALLHIKDNIRSFHCACDATNIGGFAHQSYSGVQHLTNGNQALTLHTSNGTDYDVLIICQQGVNASDIEVAPTLIHLGSTDLQAELTGSVNIDTPSIVLPQFTNGILKVDGSGNVSSGTLALSQLSDVIITGPTAQEQLVYDGAQWTNSVVSNTYTPTFGDFTNISAITLRQAWFTIVGNIITVSIRCLIDSVAASASTFSVTLPFNFTGNQADSNQVCGNCMQNSNPVTPGMVFGFIGTNDRAQCNFTAITVAPVDSTINFSYRLI